MLDRFNVTLPALTGEKERRAFVFVPEGGGRFPVIYMYDGHNLFTDEEATFGKCWGLLEYMEKTRTPAIIAAVECNHEGNGRLSEYSPYDFTFRGQKIKGRGRKYTEWLVREFMPFVNANYPTLQGRENTAIAGSSMGGLMTLYSLSKYNKYFSRGAALSPSLWACGGVPEFITNGKMRGDTVIYMDYGSAEFKNHDGQRELFSATYAALVERGVNATARVIKGGTHCEASWEKQIPVFMKVLGFTPEGDGI